MEFARFQYQTLAEPKHIRIATILPGEQDATLTIELEHSNLESCPEYECLSYAWEQDERDQPITLNGSQHFVSPALQAALYCLRKGSQERRVWIDALCINQTDVRERNNQVAMMREIYRNASRVVVWIGPASESSEQAMEFLKSMAGDKKESDRGVYIGGQGRLASDTSSELGPGERHAGDDWFSRKDSASIRSHASDAADTQDAEPGPKPIYEETPDCKESMNTENAAECESVAAPPPIEAANTEEVDTNHSYDPISMLDGYEEALAVEAATKNAFVVTGFPILYEMFGNSRYKYFQDEWVDHWRALDDLLARRWWGRTWIVQEIWSASNAILQCGTTTLKWKTFQKAMDYSEAWDDLGDNVKGTRREAQWEALRRRYTLAIHLAKERVNGSTLSSLLWNTWNRACTDPRDKVFAMLPLVGKTEKLTMTPDYGKSMQQVYREAARDIMVNQKQIDILLAASGTDREDGLPSWLPDWRCEANAKKPTLLVNRRLMMQLYISGSMEMVVLDGHGYRASGNSKPFAAFDADLNVLTLLGVITEETKQIEMSQRQAASASQDTSVLLRTLTGGGNVDYDNRAPTMRNIMRQRRLFVSQNGHLGIGPVQAQPGDDVFIISGCNFPIMLRPQGDQFIMVGEVYIHGFMKGESLASQGSQEIAWNEIQVV